MTLIREWLEHYYAGKRGLEVSEVELSADARDLAEYGAARLGMSIRGVMRLYPGTNISEGVRIAHRRHLYLGRDVSLGRGVVINAHSLHGVHLADRVTLDDYAQIRATGVIRNLGCGVEVGENTAIGAFNLLLGAGGIRIGANCLVGPNVVIVSENHVFRDRRVPIRNQGELRASVQIGDDVWVGAGSTILAGANLGTGSIVAAGAVVRGNVDPYTIVAGVPAKVLGTR